MIDIFLKILLIILGLTYLWIIYILIMILLHNIDDYDYPSPYQISYNHKVRDYHADDTTCNKLGTGDYCECEKCSAEV